MMKIDPGIFEKEFKIFHRNTIDIDIGWRHHLFTFDPWYDLNIQLIQNLSTGHALVQISGLYYEVNRGKVFSMIESKLQEYQIKVTSVFSVLSKWKM